MISAIQRKFGFHKSIDALPFLLVIVVLNTLIFNAELWHFALTHLDLSKLYGWKVMSLLVIVVFSVTLFFFGLILALSTRLFKALVALVIVLNAVALYFMVSYDVMLDRSMMGNVFNTDTSEAGSYFSLTLVLYVTFLGIFPALWFIKKPVINERRWFLLAGVSGPLLVTIVLVLMVSKTWFWFDEYGKQLGAKVLPWSYVANSVRYFSAQAKQNEEAIRLPDGNLTDKQKQVVVLVIGESARAQNFSQYGYERDTLPEFSAEHPIVIPRAHSCATYTTGALRCILAHQEPGSAFSDLYEPLPSYLKRHGIHVIWRSNNWGEPPVQVDSYLRSGDLQDDCQRDDCQWDGVLLSGLKQEIAQASQQKVFVVLHLKGSHGPNYTDRYPPSFEIYQPVCADVQVAKCSHESLINAYDNSLRYTDHILSETTRILRDVGGQSALFYLSDHGESMGEAGLYLHGTPMTLAPAAQTEIPFFMWLSPDFLDQNGLIPELAANGQSYSQMMIFHSVLGVFGVDSPVYQTQLDLTRALEPKAE